jgi:hypothetical protein
MADVVEFTGITTLDIPAERVLEMAGAADLDVAIVVGCTKDGELYFASTDADGGTALWYFELAKRALIDAATEC